MLVANLRLALFGSFLETLCITGYLCSTFFDSHKGTSLSLFIC